MSRTPAIFATAVALVIATFAALWGPLHTASAAPGEGSAATMSVSDGLKCYRVSSATSQLSDNQRIYISDQFEEKELVVKRPIAFCNIAFKFGTDPGQTAAPIIETSPLMCYAIKDAPGQSRFRPVEIGTIDQFNDHVFTLTRPYSLCEPAQKSIVPDNVSGTDGEPLDSFEFKCYRVRRQENRFDRFEKIEVEVADQFGGKDLRLGRPTVFCTQVWEKKNKAKNDDVDRARILSGPEDEHHVSTIGTDARDREDPPASCVPSYGHSVWYSYTPSVDGEKIVVSTEDSTYDTVVAIYEGTNYKPVGLGEDPIEIACNDDKDFPTSGHSLVEAKLDYGEQYYIMVGAYGSDDAGKLKLQFESLGACASCFDPGGSPAGTVSGKGAAVEAAGQNEIPWNLNCYSISQRAPEDVELLTSDQLNQHIFQPGRGIMYCTPAEKCIIVDKPEMFGVIGAAGGPKVPLCGR